MSPRDSCLSIPVERVVALEVADHAPLLARLGIPIERHAPESAFVLTAADGALELRPPGELARAGIGAVFPPDREPSGRRSLLARAFGSRIAEVHDLTAGLGGDAYRLAEAGLRVHAIERDPAVFALLTSAWERDRASGRVPPEIAERLEFTHADALDVLTRLDAPDLGVYIDPMYPPPRRKSAKPRRALQVLRSLLGAQSDAAELVASARARAARVVVKRPPHAAPLAPDVSFELESKLVRFDVYVNPERMGRRPS